VCSTEVRSVRHGAIANSWRTERLNLLLCFCLFGKFIAVYHGLKPADSEMMDDLSVLAKSCSHVRIT
jgi:hypothetical protein